MVAYSLHKLGRWKPLVGQLEGSGTTNEFLLLENANPASDGAIERDLGVGARGSLCGLVSGAGQYPLPAMLRKRTQRVEVLDTAARPQGRRH